MTKYSGRTSMCEHKHDGWEGYTGPFNPSIVQQTIFHAQWTECPVEVEDAVKQLWQDYELGNDSSYVSWKSEELCEDYPIIDEYLKSKGVTECLIHWWW